MVLFAPPLGALDGCHPFLFLPFPVKQRKLLKIEMSLLDLEYALRLLVLLHTRYGVIHNIPRKTNIIGFAKLSSTSTLSLRTLQGHLM